MFGWKRALAAVVAVVVCRPTWAARFSFPRCEGESAEACAEGYEELQRTISGFGQPGLPCSQGSDFPGLGGRSGAAELACPTIDDFRNPRPKPNNPSYSEFVRYAAPFAVRVQQETGVSAALLIAKAWVESGGRSRGYRERNNPFGTRCFQSSSQERSVQLASGGSVSYLERCLTPPRPSYYSFESLRDAFWSQAYFYLHREDIARAMSALRSRVASRPDRNAPVPARALIPLIRGYAQDGLTNAEYHRSLFQAIEMGNLEFFEGCRMSGSGAI